MKQLRPLLIALLLATSFSVSAKSDMYYSQGLDIDFGLASENESLKTTLASVVERFFEFLGPIADNSMKINFDYYLDVNRELDN